MPGTEPPVFDSAPERHDDRFWIEQGRTLITESFPSVRDASTGLLTALTVVQGIYLGILGFSEYLPEDESLRIVKALLYLLPFGLWLGSSYFCLSVLMTKRWDVFANDPDDVRGLIETILKRKQQRLQAAFWLFTAGLICAVLVLIVQSVSIGS